MIEGEIWMGLDLLGTGTLILGDELSLNEEVAEGHFRR